jgi:CheY-specific phosphatase CheX
MSKEVDSLLSMARDVTAEVLETMFFSTAAAIVCDHSGVVPVNEEWISSRVRFAGAPSGELRVMLSRELARSIAAGFLGSEPEEITLEAEGQVGCELGNMICGAVLSRVHPDSRVALAPPELTPVNFGDGHEVHQCFATPDGLLSVNMHIDAGTVPGNA